MKLKTLFLPSTNSSLQLHPRKLVQVLQAAMSKELKRLRVRMEKNPHLYCRKNKSASRLNSSRKSAQVWSAACVRRKLQAATAGSVSHRRPPPPA